MMTCAGSWPGADEPQALRGLLRALASNPAPLQAVALAHDHSPQDATAGELVSTEREHLTVPRRYWPQAHDVLSNTKGKRAWAVVDSTGTPEHSGMIRLSLEPHLINVLKEALPAGAVLKPESAP